MALPRDWQATFEGYIKTFKAEYDIPGLAICVVTADDVVYQRGFGHRNLEEQLPVTPNTRFGVASITKSFTALALLQLSAKGLLNLDDSITRYVPNLRLWKGEEGPTLRHFLTHTSGFPALPGLTYAMAPSQKGDPIEEFKNPPSNGTPPPLETYAELVAFLNGCEGGMLGPPGRIFCYQNDAYGLLGSVIEEVTGQDYPTYVIDHITRPLGMSRTCFDLASVLRDDDSTTLYAQDPEGKVMASPLWQEAAAYVAAGFLRSTAFDLALYTQLYLNASTRERLGISDSLFGEMTKPAAWCKPQTNYALGLMVQADYHGATLIGHSGGLKGVSSYFGFVPELGIGAVVLSNLGNVPVDRLWLGVINLVLELPIDAPFFDPPEYRAEQKEIVAILGSYQSGEPWGKVELFLDDGSLQARVGEEGKVYPARLVGPDDIVVEERGSMIGGRLLRTSSGEVYGLHYSLRVLHKNRS